MAALFAAFIHDVGHPGRNNNYLIATGEWVGRRKRNKGVEEEEEEEEEEGWGALSVFAFEWVPVYMMILSPSCVGVGTGLSFLAWADIYVLAFPYLLIWVNIIG